MIDKIKITDLSQATSNAFSNNKNEYDIWISVVDEDDRHKIARIKKLLNKKNIIHYSQYFYDWSDEDCVDSFTIRTNIEEMGPTKEKVERIINFLDTFVKDDKVHNLGVNCFAGISRSSAIGIIASVMSGKTPDMALSYILSVRPEAYPNLRILKLASKILNIDIYTVVKEWKNNVKGTLWTF
jgi:predicted protein tyrosine phosphatase